MLSPTLPRTSVWLTTRIIGRKSIPWLWTNQSGVVKFYLDHDVHADDSEALGYARGHGLFLITCNRDDF